MQKELKTEYRHLRFCSINTELLDGKILWNCRNTRTNDLLGGVDYYEEWGKYVFWSANNKSVFDSSCLRDIADFMDQLNKRKKHV